jgi:hypothetical protein
MAGPSVASPGAQGQGGNPPTPPTHSPNAKDATGTVLRADEKELAFTLKIPNSESNLAKVHKAFIDALYRVTDNEVTLLCSNNRTVPVPDAIREPKDFPKDDTHHRAFFRRHANQRDTLVHHLIIISISIDELKKRMLLTLQANNLWMTNDSLKSKEMSVIAFVWKAPTRLIHRPTFAKKLNDYLGKMELNFEQQNLLQRASNDAELPELPQVYVNIRTIKHGNANRVETEAPAILANKPYARLMKELISQIPIDAIGYDIVPCGMVAKIGEENYRNALLANNDYNNSIRSIEILYLHASHFDLEVTHNNEHGTIGAWFKSSPFIIDVQPSNRSEEIGKYFVIVEDSQIVKARREISSLLRVFQTNTQAYGNHYPRFPCIANGPISDGATERTAESLSRKFAALQSDPHTPTQGTDSLTAWTPARNDCVFDWQSTREFPAPSTETPPSPVSQTKTRTTQPDDTATNARSAYTTDVDTTVSDLKTVFTESMAAQSKMLQQFMANSQQQQQQLMQAHQSQQASTNQILHHLSSLMSTMVSGTPSPHAGAPPPPIPSTVNVTSPNAPSNSQTSTHTPSSHKSPNKRPAPPDSAPIRRREASSHDSDTTMSNTNHPSTLDPNAAAPLLDPDPMRTL